MTRETPVALTRAGFLYEWLHLPDSDAARWAEPKAVSARSRAYAVREKPFDWVRLARCGASPEVWEIAVRPHEAKTLVVFRVSGSRATELRMLSISDRVTPSCVPEDPGVALTSVGAELPW